MSDTEKIYEPETIADTPLPSQQDQASYEVSNPGTESGGKSPATIQNQSFPIRLAAVELISSKLNTKTRKIIAEFSFAPSGAIQIGNYQEGETGDVRISPNGIVARDHLGNETLAVDSETGDAVFAGTIQTGTLIAGLVVVGNNRLVFDGEAGRILVNNGTNNNIAIGNLDF